MSAIRWVLPATILLLIAGCASLPSSQYRTDRRAAYEKAAGAPVSSFHFASSLYSWEPLSDDELVVYTRPTQAWLLNLAACRNLDITNTIGLTSNFNEVSVNFDSVLTERAQFPCAISQIRPVDLKGMKAAAEKREIKSEPRQPAVKPPAQ
jgi:hypothetical protein